MAKINTVWGLDIGQCALKALKLADDGEEVQVEAFELIEHPAILSQPETDRPQLIRESLETFLARQSVAGSTIALAVPGQSSFTRFFKPPPVESRELPRIVQYEAAQQIPFPIDEVIWRWQAFEEEDSPDLEVGIFAMKRVDVAEMLSHLEDISLHADVVQIAPLALYNFMTFDEQLAPEGATLLADVGADKTDLVVADGARIWTRTIQIGGSNFTEALGRAFKLSFEKAEKLKRTAATSKYARQVFQAMRPVFADLVQEIQRSVGYYISLHRESKFTKLLGLGDGFRLPGLQKFLEQKLNVPVVRVDSYNHLAPGVGLNVPGFAEAVPSFGVAYGLAIQALRPTRVTTNLLPKEIARRRLWAKKVPWFAGAAAALLLSLAAPPYRAYMDRRALNDRGPMKRVESVRGKLLDWQREYAQYINAGRQEEQQITQYVDLFGYRNAWPEVQAMVADTIRSVTAAEDHRALQGLLERHAQAAADKARQDIRDQLLAMLTSERATPDVPEKLKQYAEATGETAEQQRRDIFQWFAEATSRDVQRMLARYVGETNEEERKRIRDRIKGIDRSERRVIFVKSLLSAYDPGIASSSGARGGFVVVLSGRTSLPKEQTIRLQGELRRQSHKIAADLGSISVVACEIPPPVEEAELSGAETEGAFRPDPFLPEEDMSRDMRFTVQWKVVVDNNGLKAP